MRKNLSGFTLIEIIVVIIIIGVIAGVGLPKFFGTFERTKVAEGKQILLSLLNAQKIHYLENASHYAADITDLDIEIPSSLNFDTIIVADDPSAVAKINRPSLYTLFIKEDGTFTCTNIAAGACTNAGL